MTFVQSPFQGSEDFSEILVQFYERRFTNQRIIEVLLLNLVVKEPMRGIGCLSWNLELCWANDKAIVAHGNGKNSHFLSSI